jgi:beta-phosphoglucomutase-like phosphatase (HAD superfamily)
VSVPAAVLIDLDGTLVDTVGVWHAAYLLLATELGVTAPDDLWPRVAGRSMLASLEVFGAATAGHDPDVLVGRLVALAAAGLGPDTGWSWLPGAEDLLATLRPAERPAQRPAQRSGPALALVTSAWRAFTEPLLAVALGDAATTTFDAVVCGDDVTAGKPDPESHLRAARLLGAAPEDCLVIEDSPTGVAAAEAAGMVVLAVPHAGPVAPAPGRAVRATLAGLTLRDLAALHARLRSGAAT